MGDNQAGALIHILDPTGKPRAQTLPLAPRVADLDGKRIGFLDNAKPNADVLLSRLEALLVKRFQLTKVTRARKRHPAVPAEPEMARQLAENCDVVVTALGD
ncbi:MAG: hypothetical protein HYX89_07105 [Chloroflexi bacterium]|nr:hypothetical protein [Chloroflexota bacterium]